MPTFGKTSIGATFNNFPAANANSASRFTLPDNAVVRKITAYFKGTSVSPLHEAGNVRCSIYDSQSGEPVNLLATSTPVNIPTGTDAWYDFTFSANVNLPAGDYYLCVNSTLRKVGAMDTAGTNRNCDCTYVNGQVDPWHVASSVTSSLQKSIYVTYDIPAVGSASGVGTATGVSGTLGSVGTAAGVGTATGVGETVVPSFTFGKTDVGATINHFPNASLSACRFTLSQNGNVSKLTVYFKGTNSNHVGGDARCVIYDVSGGEPNALVAQSDVVNVPDGVDGWIDFPLPSPISLTAADYYLGIISAFVLEGAMTVAGVNRLSSASGLTPPNPFGTSSSSSNQKSIYATYTTGAVTTSAAGSAAGVGTATGRAPYRSVGAASGTGTATGVGSSTVNVNIAHVGSAAAGTNTLSIPVHVAGDLLLAYAFRAGSTVPTLPAGWIEIRQGVGSGTAAILAYRIATAPGTAFGTWTNAESVEVAVYRNFDTSTVPPIGIFDMDAGSTAAMTYAALALTRANNTSWVAGFAGIGLQTSDIQTPPTGMTNRANAASGATKIAGHDTNGAVNVWALQTVTLNGAAPWRSITVEILGTTGGTPPADLGKQYGRPISDIATDNWTPSVGTQLAPTLDETAPVDSDFIQTVAAPTTDTAVVLLSPMIAPQNTAGPYTIRVRARTVPAGSTTHVPAGGNLKAAVAAANPGATITIAANAVYDLGTEPLIITKPVTIMTQGWNFNGRVGLAQKSAMGQIVMTSGNQVIIVRGGAATDVTIKGVYVAGPGNVIINLGENDTTQTSYDQMPTRCTVDQCIVNGVQPGVTNTGYHGVMLHCAYGNVYRSYIYNIYRVGTDSTGVGGVNGTGPYNIVDNYISAASECTLFGGVTPQIDYNIPADILIEGNTLEKDPAWMDVSMGVAIKNMVEFKTGRRCMVRNNTMGYQWFSGQGYSLVVTPSQYSGPPWQICEDITFERNIIGPTCGGMNLLGHGQNQNTAGRATLVSNNITVRDNWFIVDKNAYLPGQSQGQGWFFLFGNGMKNLVIEYNTVEMRNGGGEWVCGTSNGQGGFPTGHRLFRNIIHDYGTYGTFLTWGDPTANPPIPTSNHTRGLHFFDYFPGAIAVENALIGPQTSLINSRLPGNLCGSVTTYPASLIVNGYGTGPLAGYGRRP